MANKNDEVRKKSARAKTSRVPKTNVAHVSEEAFRIVGIGASAGGLEAFEQFFSNMPSDKGIAFVMVQHLDPKGHSSMPQILSRFTRMSIEVATDGMRVKPNSIYVLPPNKSMGIQNGALYLQEPTRPPGLRLPIDFFFRSLAGEMGADAICIILSGTGTDGTLGLRAVKAELGTVFVQDPGSARYDGMPRSAIDTGLADFVLKPGDMPEKLIQFVEHSVVNGAKFGTTTEESVEPLKQIFSILRTRAGHDFSRYKQTTIRRRLQRRMSVNQINDITQYTRFLKDSENEVKALLKDLLISVTSFFRDTEAFEALKRQMKERIKNKPQGSDLRVWVAGCATGEEAYSVAIIIQECLDELAKNLQIQMYGTDIDIDALHVARAGKYPGNIAADVTPDRLKSFFIQENDAYRVKKNIRESIVFAPQNFIKDPPFSRMDLICCRNLLIYLEADVQKRLLPLLHYALKPGGILFLGPSETAGEASDLFNLFDRKWKIYQRREAIVSTERLNFPAAFAPAVRTPTGESVSEEGAANIPERTEKIFLDNYAPTFAVIDEKYRLVYVRGRTGRYLEIASGQPSWTVLDMAREGLRTELTSAVYRAVSEKSRIVHNGVRVKTNGDYQTVNLTVAPIKEPGIPPGLLMVIFEEVGSPEEAKIKPSTRSRKRVVELEDELRLTKENLQTTIEELEATNEELKSANEELQSNNEELQSTNEELDTSREELQSLNEELTTLNAELQDKNDLLSNANDDLRNFLNRTDIAIIFLDDSLKIRRYTPATSDVFNIREIDVGRPLSDITSRLAYEGVVADAREVLRTLHPIETEVQREDEAWYKMRIMPYLTSQNVISGLVMSFLDIDAQKKAADELEELNQKLEDMARFPQENPNPTMRVDKEGTIVTANPACSKIEAFKCKVGQSLPKQYQKVVTAVIRSGSPEVKEIEGKNRIFILNFVPVTKSGYVNIYGNDITDRKKAEKDVAFQAKLLSAVGESVIATNPEGYITYWGEGAARIYGWQANEVIGKKLQEIIGARETAAQSKEIMASLVKGKAWSGEYVVRRRDGTEFPILVNSTPVKDENGSVIGIIGISQDISELKKKEEEYRVKDLAISSAIAGIALANLNGKVTYVNPAFLEIWGYKEANEVLGRTTREFFVETKIEQEAFNSTIKNGSWQGELEGRRKNGSTFNVLIVANLVRDTKGNPILVMASFSDITERKRVEHIKDEFIGMVSHELKTPLTVIIGALGTAMDKRVSQKDIEELVHEASLHAESLASILDNMLELSRYQAGRLRLEMEPGRISDIARNVVQQIRRKYESHNIILEIPDNMPEMRLDSIRIGQVMYNLLENAVKYSPAGSEIRVFSRQEKDSMVVGVSDRGAGIAPDDQKKLFEPFSRLNESGAGGIGLGLVVCKHLVEAHGGRIWIESQPGQGSTFLFSIPRDMKKDAQERKSG